MLDGWCSENNPFNVKMFAIEMGVINEDITVFYQFDNSECCIVL